MNEEVKKIEAYQADSEILKMYELLKDEPLVRWKDSIKEVLAKNGVENAID